MDVDIIENKRLEEIAQIYNGLRITRHQNNKDAHIQKVLKKINNNENILQTEQITLSKGIDEKFYSKKDDIIIQHTSQINTINIINEDNIIIPANYVIIRTKKQYNPHYIKYIMTSKQFKKVERKLIEGTKLQFIKIPDIKKMKIKIPSPEKQDKIVQVMKLIDKKNKLEEKKMKTNKKIQDVILTEQLGEEYVQQ